MGETELATPEVESIPESVESESSQTDTSSKSWIFILVGVIVLGGLIALVILLLQPGNSNFASQLRDVFIILMALVSIVIGISLVILVIQLAILTNLLQNEIKPILKATNETANTLKGTATFISDNLSEPVIVINEFMAVAKKFFQLIRFKK
ncbi:MAG: hypothetical protein JEZ06_21215 [Anaerolineaceae bacterium]|nr:hypothetical protein [Anaerolineaceae bacterium]